MTEVTEEKWPEKWPPETLNEWLRSQREYLRLVTEERLREVEAIVKAGLTGELSDKQISERFDDYMQRWEAHPEKSRARLDELLTIAHDNVYEGKDAASLASVSASGESHVDKLGREREGKVGDELSGLPTLPSPG
jgi:hypothetical protein